MNHKNPGFGLPKRKPWRICSIKPRTQIVDLEKYVINWSPFPTGEPRTELKGGSREREKAG